MEKHTKEVLKFKTMKERFEYINKQKNKKFNTKNNGIQD